MSRIPTAEVPIELLNRLFDEFDIWAKIHDSRLISEIASSAPSHKWSNATAMIIKHFQPNDKHIGVCNSLVGR